MLECKAGQGCPRVDGDGIGAGAEWNQFSQGALRGINRVYFHTCGGTLRSAQGKQASAAYYVRTYPQ